jgi:hypothetical protein
MAHYAVLNMNNIVTEIIVGKNENDTNINWELYYQNIKTQICKRTSYNTKGGVHINGGVPFRKNYAGIGYTYDNARDAFIPPKPYDSWILNEDSCLWEAPVEYPNDDNQYIWNEETQNWNLATE